MKKSLSFLVLFIALTFVFSNLTGCTNTANSQKGPVDEKKPVTANSAEAKNDNTGKSSQYPLAPSGILQTDIKKLDGNMFKVEDLKGQVVLLNLWATWCGPCRKEMPELVAMESELKDKGFKIIGLNTDNETPEQINPFVQQMKLNYEIAWADEKLVGEFFKVSKFGGIPQSFLIDREGHLRGVFVGGSPKIVTQLRENVEKVVAE
jgi:thiol-disulfide isomerase/thioredoxin